MEPVGSSEIQDSTFLPLLLQCKAIEDTIHKSITLNGKVKPEINIAQLTHAIKMGIKADNTKDINDCLERMIRVYSEDEICFKSVLHVIYQVLKIFSQNLCQHGSISSLNAGWAELLIDVLFSNKWKKTTISDVLLCLKLYLKTFFEVNIVRRLWQMLLISNAKSDTNSITATYILIHFIDEFSAVIDDFGHNTDFETFVSKLLQSDEREERKGALYLMKKQNTHVDTNVRTFWISYITVLENLEENQSHLILPSLECLKKTRLEGINLQIWIDILFIKILSHQNILVIRWTLVYILETFSCADISLNVLLQFVKACNHTSLYNHENSFLPEKDIQHFLRGGLGRFLESISEVNLKSVPLHFWLVRIRTCASNIAPCAYELTLKIAANVRLLQNQFIRLNSIELFEDIFYKAIYKMSLSEYIVLVETLYNVTDPFNHFETLCCKLETSLNNGDEISFTQRFYEIITNNLCGEFTPFELNLNSMQADDNMKLKTTQSKLLENIANSLNNVKKPCQGGPIWIHMMLILESENIEVVRNICQSCWELNLDKLVGVPFEVLTQEITSVLSFGGFSAAFLRTKCTDFLVKVYLKEFTDFSNYMVKTDDILNTGSHKTLMKLSQLLADHKDKVDFSIIDEFLTVLKRYSRMPSFCYFVTTNLLNYLKNIYTSCQLEDYMDQILCIDLENLGICAAVLNSGVILKKKTYIQGIMIGDAYFGDARTEELYLLELSKKQCPRLQQIRLRYILSIPDDYTYTILNELLSIHKTLSIKKPRYFESSMEHRLKMRMARVMLQKIQLNTEFWNEDLLELLLNHNNQLNITYIFELLVAKCTPSDEIILKKLNEVYNYSPSQQVSLISIIHCYSFLNWRTLSNEYIHTIVNKLLPLTMGAHFQTRLYAQLVIYNILDKSNTFGTDGAVLSHYINMQEAIALAVGPQLKELLNDVRLLLPFIYKSSPNDFYDVIMYITMAPPDEYLSNVDYSKYEASKYIFSKKKSSFAKDALKPVQMALPTTIMTNMQRKMNPEDALCAESSFMELERATEFKMIVVASLIDKIPNLGGIARTCEVLGIRNLVLSSKLLAEKEEFRSVSMTAEKNLNIMEVRPTNLQEFFKEKEADGFKVIGAEQTSDSMNIISYEFPQKCILVLGHEKEGIPSNILSFLDYTIEVPQFGVLRSLNVHVTGALFMWEYCKQHIVKNSRKNLL